MNVTTVGQTSKIDSLVLRFMDSYYRLLDNYYNSFNLSNQYNEYMSGIDHVDQILN